MNTIKEAALRAYGADKAVKDMEHAQEQAEQDRKAIDHLTRVLQAWGITVHIDSPEIIIDGVKIRGEYWRDPNNNVLGIQHCCSECGGDRLGWGYQYISSLAELGAAWADTKERLCNECRNKRYRRDNEAQAVVVDQDASTQLANALANFMKVHGIGFNDDSEDYDDEPPY